MMIAAPDTTSALICSVINQVLQHQNVHNQLIAEITAATAAGNLDYPVATYKQIRDLQFFTACIQESARLFPSIPVILPRSVSKGGLALKGYFIPEGTAIGASAAVINRNPHIFGKDAAVFRPERWLDTPDRVAPMYRLMFTWGFGSRKCIGKNLALLETYKFCLQVSIATKLCYNNLVLIQDRLTGTTCDTAVQGVRSDCGKPREAFPKAR